MADHPAKRALVAASLLVMAAPAVADDARRGIAFVRTAESGGGTCLAETPEKGFVCAIEQCVAGGADRAECEPVAWCFPAGWGVDVFIQAREGTHFHEVTCGWPSREAAIRAAREKCETASGAHTACMPAVAYDPQGTRIALDP